VWYQGDYTEEMSMQAWEFVLGRYQNRWNVFAADIRSETAQSSIQSSKHSGLALYN
jgi:hypothetical protein